MKIWNGYLKRDIDFNKSKSHKATWQHGLVAGLIFGLLIATIVHSIITVVFL